MSTRSESQSGGQVEALVPGAMDAIQQGLRQSEFGHKVGLADNSMVLAKVWAKAEERVAAGGQGNLAPQAVPEGHKWCNSWYHTGNRLVPLTEFAQRTDKPDGLQSTCKSCQRASSRSVKAAGKAGKRPGKQSRQPPRRASEVAEIAAIRESHRENLYAAMTSAPPGAQNNPMFWRAAKVEALITELSVLSPEVAAGQLQSPAFRFFTAYTRQWWDSFVTACEKRAAEETPDLKPPKRSPGRVPWAESGLERVGI